MNKFLWTNYNISSVERNSFERLRDVLNWKNKQSTNTRFNWPDDFIHNLSKLSSYSVCNNFIYAVAGELSECRLIDTSAVGYANRNQASNQTYLSYSSVLRSMKITGSFTTLPYLIGCTELSALSIDCANLSTHFATSEFSNLPKLRYLHVKGHFDDNFTPEQCQTYQMLETLELNDQTGNLTILSNCFKNLPVLSEISLVASGALTINDSAFQQTSPHITKLELSNCRHIGESAFFSALTVQYPTAFPGVENCSYIGSRAFGQCTIGCPTINFPNVTKVGSQAFCSATIKTADFAFPALSVVESYAFNYIKGNQLGYYRFPNAKEVQQGGFQTDTWAVCYDLTNMESAGVAAFYQNQRWKYTIVSGTEYSYCYFPKLKQVSVRTFYNCGFEKIELPECSIFGANCFEQCALLREVNLPKIPSVTVGMFSWCPSFTHISLGATTFEAHWLAPASAASIKSIPRNIQLLDLPNCTSLPANCFAADGWSLGIHFNNGIVKLPKLSSVPSLLFGCVSGINEIQLNNCTTIGARGLQACLVSSISVPNLTRVEYGGFIGTAISSIELPKITYLGEKAFAACSWLTCIKIGTSNCSIHNNEVFAGVPLQSILVPNAYVNQYKSAPVWSSYSSYIIGY